ncbi:hypothetical protein SAMN05421773_101337 [Streptomyces aidingensis]|uniref:Uncharacterized protein n=1 Tax=Streptomyces aidingensis TaxID=910347 RepID=A0A1I1EJQ2_9ACTN|nr:hypothetical protein SAMN05421773_101337 [Streptomyces aidingensis]
MLCEAVAIGTAQWLMGLVARAQRMSLAGLSTDTIVLITWLGGALLGGLLLACAVLLLRTAVRDRLGGRPVRAVLAGSLVANALLAIVAVGMFGWAAFAAAMAVFGLVLLVMTAYPPPQRGAGAHRPVPGRPGAAPDTADKRPGDGGRAGSAGGAPDPTAGPAGPAGPAQPGAAGEPVAVVVSATDR